jgi:hypothetical protein
MITRYVIYLFSIQVDFDATFNAIGLPLPGDEVFR